VILVDTSAWVEFDRATGSAVDSRLARLIADEEGIAVTEPVVMELLAGARDAAGERDLRRLMSRFALMRFDAAVDFDAAARIYRTCRRTGVTPRGMIDCMIASVAMRNNASLLTADSDLDHVGEIMGIPVESH
jgi:predicted nucleic acid-binding protein